MWFVLYQSSANAERDNKALPFSKILFFSSDNTFMEKNLLQYIFSKRGTLFLKLVFSPVFPLIRSTKIVPGGKFLDVGCGSGTFLAIMSCFNMKCCDVEPGEIDQQLAKEYSLDIKNCTLEEANYPDNYFDVITMNHVLEHVTSPTMTLREINRILKPRGTLILAVPQSNCLAYRLFGRHWVALDIPRHLFTFSKKTIKEYLKRTGLRIERIRYNSTSFQFQGSLLYMTNNHSARAINPICKLLLFPIAYICNLLRIGDAFEITLSKRNLNNEKTEYENLEKKRVNRNYTNT
jgi:2-polyprenyl-3-methyl-5-hydroxy-6-metoxy-1,4-benzoquinol methylase